MSDAKLLEWCLRNPHAVRKRAAAMEGCGDETLCSAVYLCITGLSGHPLAEDVMGDLGSKAEASGSNKYYTLYRELCKEYGQLFRGCLASHQGIPAQTMNEFTVKTMEMKRQYSWSIPNTPALTELANHAPLLEVGGGTGYWASLLTERGVDIMCYDCSDEWTQEYNEGESGDACGVHHRYGDVKKGGPEVVAGTDRTLVLMWPDFMGKGTFGLECLKHYTGSTLVLVGEWQDSTFGVYTPTLQPTGQSFSAAFQHHVDQHYEQVKRVALPNWPLYKDVVTVFKRRASPLSRHWVMETSPTLGRYLVASSDIAPKVEIIKDEPLIHVRTSPSTAGISKHKEMYAACDDLKKFCAAGLQVTGDAVLDGVRADIEAKHPEYAKGNEKCGETAMIEAVSCCFHYNGFGGAVGNEGELELRVFPTISFCNHSCAPNCVVVPNEGSLRSLRSIEKGEHLNLAYLDDEVLLAPRDVRRDVLQGRWGFLCACSRCNMPYDDAEIFSLSKQVDLTEETKVAFSDPDGDVVELRVGEAGGVVYTINGEDRPTTHHVRYDDDDGLTFPDIGRGVDLPSQDAEFLARIRNIACKAGVRCEGLHLPICSCGGILASRVNDTLQCLHCNAPTPEDVASEILKQEQAVRDTMASSDKTVESVKLECLPFALAHPRHYLSYQVTRYLATNPPSDPLEAARLQGDFMYVVTTLVSSWPSGKGTINGFLADEYSVWAERLMKAGETEEATEKYNELDSLRHMNDLPNDEWANVSACQPNAQVMAFLFKD
eukprot:TRINITY_DN6101_c0_g1_i4.p1 TRINITY_DN6101_c0_g1~~TRINITY_DN6101_c0_g1_i4.p1  ORF type:complete len:772 (+),score=222.75 TRINITY_DN6101_c0_g1_i4:3094-5409(+)